MKVNFFYFSYHPSSSATTYFFIGTAIAAMSWKSFVRVFRLRSITGGITMSLKNTAIATALLAATAFASTATAATSPAQATFQVLITIQKACTVAAGAGSNINLGTVDSTAVNTSGTSDINVTCSKNTAYFVGLSPSNNSTAGAGVMAGTGTNADTVPYQLNSVSATGPVWGNTATSTAVGNGVTGMGDGAAHAIPVYATAASANFTPDTYADLVTVNVNF
jgi:spore coat protein U-like protein